MKDPQDADTIIRELFNNAISVAKQRAEHATKLFKSILKLDDLCETAKVNTLRAELDKINSEILQFSRQEYIYNFRNEKNLFNLFYNRLVFLEVNESEYIISAYELAHKQIFLLNEYTLIINSLRKYTFNDYLQGKENIILLKYHQKPGNIEESEFEKIRIWQNDELIKTIELEKHFFQDLFRKEANKIKDLMEFIRMERSYFDNLFTFNNDTDSAYFVENLQNITPVKSINYNFTNPQKIKDDFLSFTSGKVDYELITPVNIQKIQKIYNQKNKKNQLSEPPFLFWSLLKYDDWLDDIQKGIISIDKDNFIDYKQISVNITVKALQTAQDHISNFVSTYRQNDKYDKDYSEAVLTQLENHRNSLKSLKNPIYYNLLDKPELLQSVFIQNCYFSSEPEQHVNTLKNSIILNEEIEYLLSEMSKLTENQYYKISENQQLNIHLEILQLINSITINPSVYKSVFSALQIFLKDSETTRKPFYFCILELKDNLFKIFDNAIENLQNAFDLLPHDQKQFYIQKRLKEIKIKELNLNRNNLDLGFYTKEFKKVLEIEFEYIKGTRAFDFFNKYIKSEDLQVVSSKLSFQYLSSDVKPLEYLYTSLNFKINFINDLRTSKADFIEILTSKDLSKVQKHIYLDCETTQFAYIVDCMSPLFKNFNPKTIESSNLFFSKKGTKISAQNIYKNNTGNPKEIDTINKIFKELK